MDSIVLELQRKALEPKISITELVRAALLVAVKLDSLEFQSWANNELKGYTSPDKFPSYREVLGQVVVHNVCHGLVPVQFADARTETILSKRKLFFPIAEIEGMAEDRSDRSSIGLPFPPGSLDKLKLGSEYVLLQIQRTVLVGVVDAVKTAVLKWSLQLEKEGILGQGMTFSEKEKQTAKNAVYNIENFTGVIGDFSADTVAIGKNIEILSKIKELGLPENEVTEIDNILQTLPKADAEQKASLVKKGFSWLGRNYDKLGSLGVQITEFLTKAS